MLNITYVGAFVPDLYDMVVTFKKIFPLQYFMLLTLMNK